MPLFLSLKYFPLLLSLPVFPSHNTFLDARMSFFGFVHYFLALCAPQHAISWSPLPCLLSIPSCIFSLSLSLSHSLHPGRSALHWACSVNHLPLTRTLIRYGVAVDLQDHRVKKKSIFCVTNQINRGYVPFRIWIEVDEWMDGWNDRENYSKTIDRTIDRLIKW